MRKRIVAYYTPKQVLQENIALSTSKSPLKPKLVISALMKVANQFVYIQPNFKPFSKDDFKIAHKPEWVEEVFHFNKPGSFLASSIPWSQELVTSLTYTSSSLYHAIKHSIEKPEDIVFSPTSGFHHARPNAGAGFCTFAGQVVASIKILREKNMKGCYLDLDGHFGNSIEDCRSYATEINQAVPLGFNFNPNGHNDSYVNELKTFLYGKLRAALIAGDIDYVVWCHGADSHLDDDLGGRVDTEHWTECSTIFWNFVKDMDAELGRPLPVSFALFGGYRKDSYESVINLHISDIVTGINTLVAPADQQIDYTLEYAPSPRTAYVPKPRKGEEQQIIDDQDEIEMYFEDYGIEFPETDEEGKFDLKEFIKETGLDRYEATRWLLNMENQDVMQKIANGDYSEFDTDNDRLFNDGYEEIREELYGEEDSDDI